MTNLVTLDPDPCPCGRHLVRASAIHGRSDDVLSLPARDGGRVSVHPPQFALLTRDPQVREFQVVQDGPVLRIRIVPRQAATASHDPLETRLGQATAQQLHKLGVQDPQVTVERRQQLPRSAGGKLKLVIADPASRPVHTNAANRPPSWLGPHLSPPRDHLQPARDHAFICLLAPPLLKLRTQPLAGSRPSTRRRGPAVLRAESFQLVE